MEDSEQLTETMVNTRTVSSESDIREFLDSLEVPIHNRWVDIRHKDLGAFDYDDVELVVEYRFEGADTGDN